MPPVGEITEKTDEDFPVKSASDRTHRLAGLPAIPDLGSLGCRVINATSLFHIHTPSLLKIRVVCADQLSPPPKADVAVFR